MNKTTTALVGDYFQKKAELQEFNKKAQDKSAEAGKLEQQIGALTTDINALQMKLNTAQKDMRWERLTYDEFLQLKRDMEEKSEELNGLIEALAEKNKDIAVFERHLNSRRQRVSESKNAIACVMVDQFAGEVVALAADPLKNLICAIMVSKGLNNGYTADEKGQFRDNLYWAISEAILKTVFDDQAVPAIPIPDSEQADLQIKDIISKIAEAQPELIN
ncbi:MAG: hypothetical protein WC504_01465 [Methylobacter sp.]|jgi:predicted RNase H-like nuclease (RuvC/YqgF family)